MKTLLSFIFIFTLAGVVAANAAESSSATPLVADAVLQSTGFGPEDGYAPGGLDGQRGWITTGQPAAIVPADAIQDSADAPLHDSINVLKLAQGSGSWAAHWLPASSSQAVQMDIVMELFASPTMSQGVRLGIGDLVLRFVLNETGTQARVEYLTDGALAPVVLPQVLPVNSDGALGWSRIGLHLDFDNKLWNLSINGLPVAGSQSFGGGSVEEALFMMSAGESSPALVASIAIGEASPLDDTHMAEGPGGNASKGGSGTISATPQQKQTSQTVAAMSSPAGGGSQTACTSTPENNAQPAFFTIFSPN